MKKNVVIFCILSMLLLSSLSSISIKVTSTEIEIQDNEDLPPIIRADNKFLEIYENDYNNEEVAFIDPDLTTEIQSTTDFSILDLYIIYLKKGIRVDVVTVGLGLLIRY